MNHIKSRLQQAYENVEFYASSTWVEGLDTYQKANQELFVREEKLKDFLAEESTRPRTVRDRIPYSRLAQYANYEYNASRELCYASNASGVSFYYPCVYRRSSFKEPWMFPEVEQLFIWFSYAPNFNILELLQMEELGHDFKSERGRDCRWHDFHEVSPVFYESFERTPGKSRYTTSAPLSPDDFAKFEPNQLKIETFEDMVLRMKIKSGIRKVETTKKMYILWMVSSITKKHLEMSSMRASIVIDNVRHLWSDHSRPIEPEKKPKVNILKSSLGNYFLLEQSDNKRRKQESSVDFSAVDDHNLVLSDFRHLQHLTDSLQTLEALLINATKNPEKNTTNLVKAETSPKTEVAPTRRLYSAVLQGLTNQKSPGPIDVTSPASPKEHLSISAASPKITHSTYPPVDKCSSTLMFVQKSPLMKSSISNPPLQWLTPSTHWDRPGSPSTTYMDINQEKTKDAQTNNPIKTLVKEESKYIDLMSNNEDYSAINVTSPNLSNLSSKATNTSHSNVYTGNTYQNVCFNSNTVYGNNYYVNSQYPFIQNNCFQTTTFCNTVYSNTYQTNPSGNVFPQFLRQPYTSNQAAHISSPLWFVQQNRSGLYSMAHFSTQPYLLLPNPPPTTSTMPLPHRQNHRWTSQGHFVRTYQMTPQQSSSSNQHWQNQNSYRVNSTQHIPENFMGQKPKCKVKKGSFLHLKTNTKSEDNSNMQIDVMSECLNVSTPCFKKNLSSTEGLPSLLPEKAASTSSIDYRKFNTCNEYHEDKPTTEKKVSAVFLRKKENLFSTDSEEIHKLLPIAPTISEELERQALEQYQSSDDNFYQDLERQAEEQYNPDPSENLIGPPNECLLFGGHISNAILSTCSFLYGICMRKCSHLSLLTAQLAFFFELV